MAIFTSLSLFFCVASFSFSSISFFEGGCGFEDEKEIEMTMEEFDSYYYKKLRNGGIKYRINYTLLETEKDIIEAFDNGYAVRIYISK